MYVYMNLCVDMCEYIKSKRRPHTPEQESEAVVSCLMWVLGSKQVSARAIDALKHLAMCQPFLCFNQ